MQQIRKTCFSVSKCLTKDYKRAQRFQQTKTFLGVGTTKWVEDDVHSWIGEKNEDEELSTSLYQLDIQETKDAEIFLTWNEKNFYGQARQVKDLCFLYFNTTMCSTRCVFSHPSGWFYGFLPRSLWCDSRWGELLRLGRWSHVWRLMPCQKQSHPAQSDTAG